VFLDGPLDGDTCATLMRDYLPLAAIWNKAFTFGSGPWYYLHDNQIRVNKDTVSVDGLIFLSNVAEGQVRGTSVSYISDQI